MEVEDLLSQEGQAKYLNQMCPAIKFLLNNKMHTNMFKLAEVRAKQITSKDSLYLKVLKKTWFIYN